MKVHKKTYIVLAILWLSGLCLKAQEDDWRVSERVDLVKADSSSSEVTKRGVITVHQDVRITRLDSLKRKHPGLRSGYRVQIFFGDRSEALRRKAEFREEFPDLPAYISYLAPNFRLRVGDFRTRLEAEKLKRQIEENYSGCYIVRDKIELPALPGEESEE